MTQKIAPSPDFRYVGLSRHERHRMRTWAGVASFSALLGAGALGGLSAREIVIGCIAGGASFLAARALTNAESARPISMAIVPWGVLIEEDASPRVLFWPAIKRIHMETAHSHDAGATTTLFTTVTIETDSHAWSGRTSGTAPLERLLAYLADYAEEQSHPVAYDLDGDVHGDGPFEPDCEPLLESARAFLSSTEGANRLGLPPLGYRDDKLLAPTDIAVNALRGNTAIARVARRGPARVCSCDRRRNLGQRARAGIDGALAMSPSSRRRGRQTSGKKTGRVEATNRSARRSEAVFARSRRRALAAWAP